MSEHINDRESRKEGLKRVIMMLHDGASVETVKEQFQELIRGVSHEEVAAMEQELIDSGFPVEEVTKLCDAHAAVFKEVLEAEEKRKTDSGHPIDTMKIENNAILASVEKLSPLLDRLSAGDSEILEEARIELNYLMTIEKHYLRKENILFPYLEKYGFYGPSKVMWAIHDKIRKKLKKLNASLEEGDIPYKKYPKMLKDISGMVEKEENILFPNLLDRLTEDEWVDVRNQGKEIGYMVEPEKDWGTQPAKEIPVDNETGDINLTTGQLSPEQVDLMLQHLPFDITFVDENGKVGYYSEGDRIFPRTPAIIGRDVSNCHPPKSVHIVEKIVEAFRNGEKDVAEFWIPMNDMLVHIRYFAVRKDGEFKGVVEVSQDIAPLKKIEGMKRLLDWE